MKVLFVGPYPPPHGGISVHVWSAHRFMKRTGQPSNVLNVDPRAPDSDAYIKISGPLDFVREIVRHVWNDWTLHVHTNGHNAKSWGIAAVCGLAAQFGPGAILTLHSGMAPAYIGAAPRWQRRGLALACALYRKVVCVSDEIATAVARLGMPPSRIEISPAFSPLETPRVAVPNEIEEWLGRHSPVIASALFFRPEYGFELLVEAVSRLRSRYPKIGCLVMGAGANRASDDWMFLAGDLDHELCLSLMARADVFVRPTLHDGDSISVREAVALGVPVVASNVGTRPGGVLLFEAGNVEELVQAIGVVVEQSCRSLEAAPGECLLPRGEGGAKRRMRVHDASSPNPHPALRATLSPRERDHGKETGESWSGLNPASDQEGSDG